MDIKSEDWEELDDYARKQLPDFRYQQYLEYKQELKDMLHEWRHVKPILLDWVDMWEE